MTTKKIFLILFVLSVGHVLAQQKIKWLTFDEAMALQKSKPRKIMVDVYTNWCGPCKYMDKMTFENPDVAAYVSENFYAVKFNAEGNETLSYKGVTYTNKAYDPQKANSRNSPHDFASAIGISAFPTTLFFDEKGDIITPLKGFLKPQQLEIYLKLFSEEVYKNIKTADEFENYKSQFKPLFKE